MHGIYQANSLQRKIRMLINEYSLEFVSQQCKSDYFITVLSIWGTEISAGMKKWISTQCCELHTKRKYTWAVSLGEILLQVYFLIDHFFSYYWMAFHGCILYHFLFLYSFLFSFFFLSHSFHIFFFFTSEKSFSLAMVDHFLFSYLCIQYMYEAKYKVLARKEKW